MLIGYICYSDTGIMAVQISRKSRAEVKELSRLKHDYLAYFGRYEIDLERQVVRHLLEGQLFPAITPGFWKGSTGSRAISCRSGRWIGPIMKFCGSGSDEHPLPESTHNLDRRQW